MIRLLLALALMALPAASRADPQPVTIFAAASLRGALDAAAQGYAGPVSLSFGGSGTMARQVAAGAPADLVILANMAWMDWLVDRTLIAGGPIADTPVYLLQNQLALVATTSSEIDPDPAHLAQSLSGNRLAMGQRDAVPAGIYARQWLQATGQWDALRDQLAETDNVRAALALVARGDAPLGIVYRTDAAAEAQVRIIHLIPSSLHDPIVYPAAARTDAGRAFLAHLQSPQSRDIFARAGFVSVAMP